MFRAFDDMAATAHGGDRVDTIAMHASARRAAEWADADPARARTAKAPHGHEWLTLVELWKAEPSARVWFVADPERTDLALFDPRARDLARAYRWGFVEPPFVGGARPADVDWYHMQPPNWMLDRGWSVTAEVGGVIGARQAGPPRHARDRVAEAAAAGDDRRPGRPASRRRRRRPSPLKLGGADDRDVLRAGRVLLAACHAAGRRAARRAASGLRAARGDVGRRACPSSSSTRSRRACRCSATTPGWQEPEFNLAEKQAWRWMSEKATLWVRPVGRA